MSQRPYNTQANRDEHRKENNAKAVDLYGWDSNNFEWVRLSSDDNGKLIVQNTPNTVFIDEASSSITYIGEASPGTSTSEDLWRIKKLEESGTVTSILMADGNDLFDNSWDDRASLSYS